MDVSVTDAPGHATDWVGMYAQGAPDEQYLAWQYLGGGQSPPPAGLETATVRFELGARPGDYNFRLFAEDSLTRLATSPAVSVAAPLDRPTLVSPVAGAVTGPRPVLRWQEVSGATRYTLAVCHAAGCTGRPAPVPNQHGIGSPTQTLDRDLPAGDFSWWVQARSDDAASEWSAAGAFTVAEPPPTAGDIVVFQDPSDPTPPGWSCLSCAPGDPFYRRFPVADAEAGASGGADTHTHEVGLGAMDPGSGGRRVVQAGNMQTATAHPHSHAGSAGVTGAAVHLPPYRNLKQIAPETPTDLLPAGAVVMLDQASVPEGLERYAAQDGAFIRGEGIGGTGGASHHVHDVSVRSGSHGAGWPSSVDNNHCGASQAHTHTFAGASPAAANEPPHVGLVLARVTSPGGVMAPVGTLALFRSAPGPDWTMVSGAGGPLSRRFLRGSATPDLAGAGASSHVHAAVRWTSAGPSGSRLFRGFPGCSAGEERASASHVHQATLSFGSAEHWPPFASVIVARRTAAR